MFKRLASIILPSLIATTPLLAGDARLDEHEKYLEIATNIANARLRNGHILQSFAIGFPKNDDEPVIFAPEATDDGKASVATLLRGLVPMANESRLIASVIVFREFGDVAGVDGVIVFDIEISGQQRRITTVTFRQQTEHLEFVTRKDAYQPAKLLEG